MKPTNPKDAIGSGKLPLHLVPAIATAGESLALMWGAMNYGRANWRDAGVRYTIYTDAIERHLGKLKEGQDWDSDSGLHHLWHIRACTAILLDADAAGMLTDDRVKSEAAIRALDALGPQVTRIREAMEAKRGASEMTAGHVSRVGLSAFSDHPRQRPIDDPGAHAATAVAPTPAGTPWLFESCARCSNPEQCLAVFRVADPLRGYWLCLRDWSHPVPPIGTRVALSVPT